MHIPRRLSSFVFRYMSLGFMVFSVLGCSGSQEGSLISDKLNVSDCPTSSCAQGTADPAETRLILTSPISNALPRGSTLGEVTGDCYASLYPQNFFDITLKNPGNVSMNIASHVPAGFVARCVNGKFYVPVNLSGLPAGPYTLDLQLVVVDTSGQQIRPAFKTASSVLILQ